MNALSAHAMFTVATTELRRRLRSRSALVTAFLAPLGLAVVFGTMLSNTEASTFDIGIVDAGGSALSAGVTDELVSFDEQASDEQEGSIVFTVVGSEALAEEQIDDGTIGAAIVVGATGEILVLKSPDRPISAQVGESIGYSIGGSLQTGLTEPTPLATAPLGGRPLNVMAYYGASMAGLLLFFTVGTAARSMLEDRDNSTLPRMLSGPTNVGSILSGKVLAAATLGALGFVVVWIITTAAFGATWGSPAGVILMIIGTVAAIGGVSLFIGGLTRTPQQAESAQSVVGFMLALIGGAFVPPTDTPATLRTLSRFSPNGLSLQGFSALNADNAGIRDLFPTLVGLVVFGLVFGGVGLQLSKRSVQI